MSEDTTQVNVNEQDAPIVDVATLNQDLPENYAEQKVKDEEGADTNQEGGVGSQYSVATGSYAEFKNAVNGNGYDIDNWYGWQCWDGTALLWQQFGLGLITGNGLAIGAWDLKRDVNKYDKFDLVTDVNSLRPGDVVAMRPNHIGFFDGYDGNYMRILGQNQGGKTGPNGGMAFNIVRIAKSAFAGAFRLKQWNVAPTPPRKSNEVVAQEVIAGAWGNGDDRKNRLTAAGYDFNAIQAIVNQKVSTPAAPPRLSNEQIADQVIAGAWGNGDDRRNRLAGAGYDYNAVQAIVNQKVGTGVTGRKLDDQIANEVIAGKWGNGQDRKNRLAAAGYNYGTIQAIVNRKLGF